MSEYVANQYEDGISSLMRPEEESEVYVVLQFKGPEGFYNIFNQKDKEESVVDVEDSQISLQDMIQVEELSDQSFISSKCKYKLQDLKNELIERKYQTIEYIKLINIVYSEFVIFH